MTTKAETWIAVSRELPARNQRVQWLSPSGRVCTGTFIGVWLLEGGMYVYYQPTYWRPNA